MKTALLLAILALTSCGVPRAFPVDGPNPLDEPGSTPATARELHEANIRAITGNPGYQMR